MNDLATSAYPGGRADGHRRCPRGSPCPSVGAARRGQRPGARRPVRAGHFPAADRQHGHPGRRRPRLRRGDRDRPRPERRASPRARTCSSPSPTRAGTSPTSASSSGSNGPGTGATVRTNAQGVAQVLYEAPARTDATANQTVLIVARPVGDGLQRRGLRLGADRAALRGAAALPANPDNLLPECDFLVEPAVGPVPAPTRSIVFQSTSHDPDGTIIRYEWNFGDGTSGDRPIRPSVYRVAGRLHGDATPSSTTTAAQATCVTATPGITVILR